MLEGVLAEPFDKRLAKGQILSSLVRQIDLKTQWVLPEYRLLDWAHDYPPDPYLPAKCHLH